MAAALPRLFPPPRSLTPLGSGSITLPAAWQVEAPAALLAAGLCPKSILGRYHAAKADAADAPRLVVEHQPAPTLRPGGYRLSLAATAGATLAVADAAGLAAALQTLRQLHFWQDAGLPLPALTIEDWPSVAVRGYMLDISRCKVPRRAELLALIERLAALKYNHLQLYTEHTFASRGHELVWADASPLTPDDIRALDAHARAFGLELAANQNSFGHCERFLRHAPYRHLAESPHGFTYPWGTVSPWGTTLYPCPESLAFIRGLWEQVLPCYTSPRLNIGCDEPWELGQGRSAARAAEVGKATVYLEFVRQLLEMAQQMGRQPQFWADVIFEEGCDVAALPPGSTALLWGYEANHPYDRQAAQLAAAGVRWWACPGTSAWSSLTGRWPNATANLDAAVAAVLAHGGEGLLLTDWGDNGHHQMPGVSLPPLAYAALRCWHAELDPATMDVADQPQLWGGPELVTIVAAHRALGQIWACLPQPKANRSIHEQWLFALQAELPGLLGTTPPAHLAAALDRCQAAEALLDSIDPTHGAAPDSTWGSAAQWLAEARFSAAQSRHALQRATALHPASAAATVADERQRLSEGWQLLGQWEELWLARNRPGGLHESSARWRRALATYPAS